MATKKLGKSGTDILHGIGGSPFLDRHTFFGYFPAHILGCKGQFTGKPHISWENLWFPVDFPLNQSIDKRIDIFQICPMHGGR